MKYLFGLYIAVGLSFLVFNVNARRSRFFEDSVVHKYDCSFRFDYPKNIDCACISGLWKLYESECTELATVGGDEQFCFTLSGSQISRAERLLSDKDDLAIKRDGSLLSIKSLPFPFQFSLDDTIITGSKWTLVDEIGHSFCLATADNSYCFFNSFDLRINSISKAEQGCEEGTISILPSNCVENNVENKNICAHHLVKRQAGEEASETTPINVPHHQQGRVFLGAPGQNPTNGTSQNSTLSIFDEDYVNNTDSISYPSDVIGSEIWNFMEDKLDGILGLKDQIYNDIDSGLKNDTKRDKRDVSRSRGRGISLPKVSGVVPPIKVNTSANSPQELKKNYRSPIYQFLDLAKSVMQKTCPQSYVNPEFFELAVSSFVKIQKKYYKFPEGATNYFGYWRILESLRNCIDNATTFNFTKNECESPDKPVSGTYCSFGNCSMEINAADGFEDYDPLVETVWNVFKTTHATCFPFFDKNFNDHHRFTVWMMPLFQNQINDVWKNGTAKGKVYGGIFGNMENVQIAINYCTTAQQMQSSYPWDLPRPDKIDELIKIRRKREALEHSDNSSQYCMLPQNLPKCD